jgi:hypothetical protein
MTISNTNLERFNISFSSGDLLNLPTEEMTAEQSVAAYATLQLMESVITERKEQLRLKLFEVAVDNGSVDDNGTYRASIDGCGVGKRKSAGKLDEKGLKKLLTKYNIALDSCFDQVTSFEFNNSKLEFLIDTGKIPKEEVDKLKKITYTIEFRPSDKIANYVAEAKASLLLLSK